ncbi:MAG: enoyl-CoA hydratase, partial [Betaproteobacteria bacterium HGW-Betaproteobacteria-18]
GSDEGPLRAALSKPIIAAVEGHACAGGLGVALFCDIRIVDDTAVFGVFSRRWGVPMSDGTTVRLPRIVGQGRALDMLITGRPVGADEALAIGLATRKVARGTTREEAERLARQIAEFPQVAMKSDRLSAYESFDRDQAAALRREMELSLTARKVEAQAGAARFAGGRGRHGSFDT